MTPLNRQFIKLLIILTGILCLNDSLALAQQIRKPVYAGSFYPENPDELNNLIRGYTKIAEQTPVSLPVDAGLKALILPHAGYIYSGLTAAHASMALKGKNFKKVIIIGPDHRVGFKNCAVSNATAYETPFGQVLLHPDSRLLRQKNKELFTTVRESDRLEHSIEVQIPFLQYYLDDFQILPIVTGSCDSRKFAREIDGLADPETLIIVSSDLSHYLPYAEAVTKDHETIRRILELDIEKLSDNHYSACGIIPIQALTHLARHRNWRPVLLHYSNSGDTAGPRDSVVGYTAIAYYETSGINHRKGSIPMDKEKGDILLKLARKTIAESLKVNPPSSDELEAALSDDIFKARRGTFVTLKINNRLRGCIGNLAPDKSIIEGVRDNAVNAAFHDPRFPALSRNELEHVDIEISLLTEPEILEYQNSEDLLEKLRPDIDGVIIRKGAFSATFLPQVWEQLPDKQAFLEHLCRKAGLSPDEWQRPGLEVMVYQVQYFEEDH